MIDWLGPVVNEFLRGHRRPGDRPDRAGMADQTGHRRPPLAGIEIRIVDSAGNPLPVGDIGTVYYSRVSLRVFQGRREDGRLGERRTFHGRRHRYLDEDGWLFLCDRRTDLILSGGVNVYPAEVEAVLLAHPEVADAAVIGVPDQEWGQRVTAVVQPEAGVAAGDELAGRLIEHCRTLLAGFKIPRVITFTDRLPRTPMGKVLRRNLRTADADQ